MKRGIYILGVSLAIILTLSMVSAGTFGNLWDKITGKASQSNVDLNISVTGGTPPRIIAVYNETSDTVDGGINEGPAPSYVPVVFRVEDADGIANLNNGSALVNYSKSGETTREVTCVFVEEESTGTQANYSCNVTMWWWDGPGTWDINPYIADYSGNTAYNASVATFAVGPTDGLLANQTSLTWPSISPGSSDTEANEFMGINNTGNRDRSIFVNSSDLIGEDNPDKALGANNFSVKNAAGCSGTLMVNRTDTNVTSAHLTHGNYTINDGTAQENIFFCLETSNSDLTAQAYSTRDSGAWIVKVGT